MLFTVIFKCGYGSAIYEGVRIEAESQLQAVVNAAKISKYSKICCVTEEKGLLEFADDKIIPSSFHCSNIPLVSLYKNANVKFSEIDIPITANNRNKSECDEEDFILAMRNVLLRKNGTTIPNHIMVGDHHVEVVIEDSYSGYDDCIEPFHMMNFK